MNLVRRLGAGFILAWAAACTAHAALPTVPSAAAGEAPSAVGGYGMLQAGFGMLVVLGLIFLCAWLARRFGLPRFGGGQVARVVSSTMVGQRERVVVVEVGATWLVLGVTASQVNTLHTLPAQAMPDAPAPLNPRLAQAGGLFAQKLRESLGVKPRSAG